MASRACRLILHKPTSPARWLTTASVETAVEPVALHDKRENSIFNKLLQLRLNADSDTNIDESLNQLLTGGDKPLKRFDVSKLVTHFRNRKDYQFALKLSKWAEGDKVKLNNGDRAVRIDLLAKTEGIDSAEKYFESLKETARTKKTFGALLSCYCKEKNVDKALEVFEKMKDLGFTSCLNYNNVISLYLSTNQPEKVPLLVEEMTEKNVTPDGYTYSMLMSSYASQSDLVAAEGVLENMKESKVNCDWHIHGNLATIYVNSGLLDKANSTLEKIEKMKDIRDREAFHTLISLYTRMSNKSGVNRAWEALKSTFPAPSNSSYLIMLLALSKLGDTENLEKCFREWESSCRNYDVRVSNVILESYLKRNMIEEADLIYEDIAKRGSHPNLTTLDLFANYHIKNGQIDLALKYLEMGACKAVPERHSWFPTDETVKLFLEYFEQNDDADRVGKFCQSMKKIGRLDLTVYDSLLSKTDAA